jgi:hypothetical protein
MRAVIVGAGRSGFYAGDLADEVAGGQGPTPGSASGCGAA